MSYLVTAIAGYFILSTSSVMDKSLLNRAMRSPLAFSFYVGIAAPIVFILAPFGFHMLPGRLLASALISGIAFTYASYFIYSAMVKISVSRVIPVEGGLEPLFTLLFAYSFLGEKLTLFQLIAFVLIVGGGLMLSFDRGDWTINFEVVVYCVLSAGFYAASFVISKNIFNHSDFVTGLIWTRVGVFIGALSYLMLKKNRQQIFDAPKQAKAKNMILYYSAHGLGALGSLLVYFAYSIGPVAIVNALQGTQFAFVLLISTMLSLYFPWIIKERITRSELSQKIIAIIFISTGLIFLR